MLALTLAATLALADLPPADLAHLALDVPVPDAPAQSLLRLEPIPSLLPYPPPDLLLVAALGEETAPRDGSEPARAGPSRRQSGVVLLVTSLLAFGASFAVMPLADAVAPEDSPNQGAMVARLELLGYAAGAAVVGGYLVASSPAPPSSGEKR